MRIEHKVTWQCMKQNKRRTIVTIFGVITCVAMITAVSIIGLSYQQAMVRSVERTEGTYEASFSNLDYNKAKAIQKNDLIKESLILNYDENAKQVFKYPKLEGKYRDKLNVLSMDIKHLDMMGISLVEGSLPTKEDELLVSQNLLKLNDSGTKIGDRITLQKLNLIDNKERYEYKDTNENKTYRIVGSIDVDYKESSMQEVYLAVQPSNEANLVNSKSLSVMAIFKSKDNLNHQIYSQIEDKYELNKDQIGLNGALLFYQGSSDTPMRSELAMATFIVGILILIGGVSLIYNSFAISLSERSRYLGMLSSVGATRKQKRNTILYEAFLIGLVAIPIGLISGFIGISITFHFVNPLIGQAMGSKFILEAVIDWKVLALTIVFSILLLYVSAWIPAKRASKISPVMAIRQNTEIRIRKKDMKTNRMITRIFGFEASIAMKNMKRNHSRYVATLTSLIICIVLFLGTVTFTNLLKGGIEDSRTSDRADINVAGYNKTSDTKRVSNLFSAKNIKDLKSVSGVKDVSAALISRLVMDTESDQKVTTSAKEAMHAMKNMLGYIGLDESEDMYLGNLNVKLDVLPQSDFETYCKSAGISSKQFNEGYQTILVNETTTRTDNGFVKTKWLDSKQKDKITVRLNKYVVEENEDSSTTTTNESKPYAFQVAAITDVLPSYDPLATDFPTVYLVMNESSYKRLLADMGKSNYKNYMDDLYGFMNFFYTTDSPLLLEEEIQNKFMNHEEYTISIQNLTANRQRSENMVLMASIFLYGFMVLIVLICSANIMNTMSTSIQLRKREFAMIKSVGITPRKFAHMIAFESVFYGAKSLIYGIPLGVVVMFLLHKTIGNIFGVEASFLTFVPLFISVIGIFVLTSITMMYSIFKIRKDNIVETIRQESI